VRNRAVDPSLTCPDLNGAETPPLADGRNEYVGASSPLDAMSQTPFANPAIRYGIGASGALVIAVVAYLFLDGTTQLVAYAVALVDLLVTPQILKRAATA